MPDVPSGAQGAAQRGLGDSYSSGGGGGYGGGGGGGSYGGGGGGGYSSGPRTMYPTVCSACGKETEVPFEPRSDKPVYCRECFQDRRPANTGYSNSRW